MSGIPPILSPGTQVVIRTAVRDTRGTPVHPPGSLGVILQSPSDAWHSYRVKFADGFECSMKRDELSVLTSYQAEALVQPIHPMAEYDLFRNVIFRCVVGSRAYGLEGPESDTDRRGIYLPPADLHWSLYGVPEQLESDPTQEVYWEAQKFVMLALKANPNVLECLYSPIVEHATPMAGRLIAMRASFLSKLVYQTYTGYVMSQFKKLQADIRNRGTVKWKHVMHLIRLLLAGIGILRDGELSVAAGSHRQRLIDLKEGTIAFEHADAWRLELHAEFEAAYAKTLLPQFPDYQRANAWLLEARRSALT